jgi:hypothetical protein
MTPGPQQTRYCAARAGVWPVTVEANNGILLGRFLIRGRGKQ